MAGIRTGVVMDPISGINPAKDSSLAMLLAAQSRNHELYYFELDDLRLLDGEACGRARPLQVRDGTADWFTLGADKDMQLRDLDVLLMRKDPPFNLEFIYATYILERAEMSGVLVINRPASLRDINEKVFTAWFPQCCPTTLITRSMVEMREFCAAQGSIVVKPLHGMGGKSIFVVNQGDNNANVIFETLTEDGTAYAMAQRYLPEIKSGDKRIILVNGNAPQHALARVPGPGDNRGNLVMGATGELRDLTSRDRWICEQVGPELRRRGVLFAGLDVIGDYLTEINVTSPTGLREIRKLAGIDLAIELLDCIDKELAARRAAA